MRNGRQHRRPVCRFDRDPPDIAIALDRQERGTGELSAAQEVNREYGIPCTAIAGLDDLIRSLTQPVLGICLGMQLLCEHSEENDTPCLGIIPQTNSGKSFDNIAFVGGQVTDMIQL